MTQVPAHFFRQSAVLPYRVQGEDLQILLVTSRKKRRWVVPKGVQEPGLSPDQSAAKEALEEAGVEGQVESTAIGSYRYDKWGGTCTVLVFPMLVETMHEDWLESERERQWQAAEEAASRVEEPELKQLIREFAAVRHRGG